MPIFQRVSPFLITSFSALSIVKMMLSSIFFSSYLLLCYCYPLGIKSIVLQGTAITNVSITNVSVIHSPIINNSLTLGNSTAGTLTFKPNIGVANLTSDLSNKANSNNGNVNGDTGASGLSRQASSVMSAANAFANDVMTVSSSLNALRTCTNSTEIRSLAQRGYYGEKDEDNHAVLNRYVASNPSQHL
jgi:hypothetical protein